jgi:hypothetical protein
MELMIKGDIQQNPDSLHFIDNTDKVLRKRTDSPLLIRGDYREYWS